MSKNYAAPEAELKDDATSRNRVAHSFIAATSCFLSLPIFASGILIYIFGEVAQTAYLRILIMSLICAFLSGLIVLPFRTLSWYWAILAGALLAPSFILFAGIVHDVLN